MTNHQVKPKNNEVQQKEYRVKVISESGIQNIIFGDSSLPIAKMEHVMNHYGAHGWKVVEQIIESQRFYFFWRKEVVVITFERDKLTETKSNQGASQSDSN